MEKLVLILAGGDAVGDGEQHAGDDKGQMDAHLPSQLFIIELRDIDKGLEQLDRGDGDNGADEFDFQVREADLAHPRGTVFVVADTDFGDEIFIPAKGDNQ